DAAPGERPRDALGDPVHAVEVDGLDTVPFLGGDLEVGHRRRDAGEGDQGHDLREGGLECVDGGDGLVAIGDVRADPQGLHAVGVGDLCGGAGRSIRIDVDDADVPPALGEVEGG